MSILHATAFKQYQWLSIPEDWQKGPNEIMHMKVTVIETTYFCHDFLYKIGL